MTPSLRPVLLVEDNPDDEQLTLRSLRKAKISNPVLIARNGEEALTVLSKLKPFDSALNRQYEGTGLGLALVKRIVELHQGYVELSSEVGVGSCFSFTLPYRRVNEVDSLTPSSTSFTVEQGSSVESSSLILVAEDNEASLNTLASYLTVKGYRLLTAKNGTEAVQLATSKRPNIILMDIQMPGMDGLEATQLIRQNPDLEGVPILALTALAMEGDRDRCLAAGATDYLTKPVKLRELVQQIERMLVNSKSSKNKS